MLTVAPTFAVVLVGLPGLANTPELLRLVALAMLVLLGVLGRRASHGLAQGRCAAPRISGPAQAVAPTARS